MVLSWFGRPRRPQTARRPRTLLRLEALEPRWVPSAIRNIAGFTTNTLRANDDASTGAVNVGFNLNFFGVQTNQVFVNNNGNVSLGRAFGSFIPSALNTDDGRIPLIAPFFADVDTTQNSSLVSYGTTALFGRSAFGVDWVHVNYYNTQAAGHINKFDNFQLILVDRSDTGLGNFDIEFNYDTINWETGDRNGGINGRGGSSAQVGFTDGTGVPGTFFEVNGSGTPGSFLDGGSHALIAQENLSTTPGRLHFLVRNGQVIESPGQLITAGGDVSGDTRVFAPFRFITDTNTDLQTGNLTLVNLGIPGLIRNSASAALALSNVIDASLDISTTGGTSGSTLVPSNPTFPGPITVVFNNLPLNVQLLNATGRTATGKPFITVDVPDLPASPPVLRVPIEISNSTLDAPTTFFISEALGVQTFAGPFNPSQH